MSRFKKPLLFTLALLPAAVVGGYFAVRMSLRSVDPSILAEAVRQVGSEQAVVLISTVQPVIYALVCGFCGYILAEKIGLMRPFRPEKSALCKTLAVSVLGGGLLSQIGRAHV